MKCNYIIRKTCVQKAKTLKVLKLLSLGVCVCGGGGGGSTNQVDWVTTITYAHTD